MRRVEFHEAFEPGLRLVRPATDEVVVAEVIQQRCRGRAISKGLPIETLSFLAFLLVVKFGGPAQPVVLARGIKRWRLDVYLNRIRESKLEIPASDTRNSKMRIR
jgi:hypothetical protein